MDVEGILERVRKTVGEYHLLSGGERVLIAFSGGADSVFLLEAMLFLKEEFNLTLAIAHFHHGLRGEDADLDLEFSRRRAQDVGVRFFWGKRDIRTELRRKGGGLETVARHYRLQFLLATLKEWNGDLIATGHTLTDSIETSFFNLLRGSGLAGLSGIPPKRGIWIRPIIEVSREEIREWLKKRGLEWREDRTNLEPITPRNFLRLGVFSVLKEKFPSFEGRWANTIKVLRDAQSIVNQKIQEEIKILKKIAPGGTLILDRNRFLKLPYSLKRAIIYSVTKTSFKETEEVLSLIGHGGERKLSSGEYLEASFGDIFIGGTTLSFNREVELSLGETPIDELNMLVSLTEGNAQEKKFVATFPKQGVYFPIKVRKKRQGDRIFLRNKMKKLKEIFIESRVPRWRRNLMPIIEDKRGILWVPGLSKSERKPHSLPYLIISIRRLSDEKFWIYDI